MKRKGLAVRQAALIQTGGFIFLDAYLRESQARVSAAESSKWQAVGAARRSSLGAQRLRLEAQGLCLAARALCLGAQELCLGARPSCLAAQRLSLEALALRWQR